MENSLIYSVLDFAQVWKIPSEFYTPFVIPK